MISRLREGSKRFRPFSEFVIFDWRFAIDLANGEILAKSKIVKRMPQRYVSNKNESVRMFESDFMELFSHVHPVTPLVIFVALLLAGIISFMRLDVNDSPDIVFPGATITIAQPGNSSSASSSQSW